MNVRKKPLRILVIENEAVWRGKLNATFQRYNRYRLSFIKSFAEAEEFLLTTKLEKLDAVVIDIRLREQIYDQGGLALLDIVKRQWPEMPVLILTAYAYDYPGLRSTTSRYRKVLTYDKDIFINSSDKILDLLFFDSPPQIGDKESLPDVLSPPQIKKTKQIAKPRKGRAGKISILFLSADPTNNSRLRLGQEHRDIQERLQLAKMRDKYVLHARMSLRPGDISQAILDTEPQFVHFSGHGVRGGYLCFEDESGKSRKIEPAALASLFELVADRVHCVILNSCYSKPQAEAIAKHIDYVIGMSKEVGDKAAIAFAVGFYKALGAGRPIDQAFKFGIAEIRMEGMSEHLIPVLIRKN